MSQILIKGINPMFIKINSFLLYIVMGNALMFSEFAVADDKSMHCEKWDIPLSTVITNYAFETKMPPFHHYGISETIADKF